MSVKTYRRKLDIKNGRVDLSHGAGGRAMGFSSLLASVWRAVDPPGAGACG